MRTGCGRFGMVASVASRLSRHRRRYIGRAPRSSHRHRDWRIGRPDYRRHKRGRRPGRRCAGSHWPNASGGRARAARSTARRRRRTAVWSCRRDDPRRWRRERSAPPRPARRRRGRNRGHRCNRLPPAFHLAPAATASRMWRRVSMVQVSASGARSPAKCASRLSRARKPMPSRVSTVALPICGSRKQLGRS